MLELNQRPTISNMQYRTGSRSQQPRRLLLALGLLMVALIALLVKDRQFWFGSTESPTIEADVDEPTAAPQAPATPTARHAASPAAAKTSKKTVHVATVTPETKPAEAPVVATTRTVLPPLDVEVVAGDKHHKVHPGTNSTHLEIPNAAPVGAAASTNAAEREAIPAAAPQQASVNAPLPMLAQHMNVQGSVVLQALVGSDGVIENLRVVSGPAILAAAAQQAVREWRFKPVVQRGQAVETKATITVNFTIKVADNSPKTTIAESRGGDELVVSR